MEDSDNFRTLSTIFENTRLVPTLPTISIQVFRETVVQRRCESETRKFCFIN